MPTYVYKCQVCSVRLEVQHSMDDSFVESCVCGASMIRVLSPTTVMFKGSGFYSTDKKS